MSRRPAPRPPLLSRLLAPALLASAAVACSDSGSSPSVPEPEPPPEDTTEAPAAVFRGRIHTLDGASAAGSEVVGRWSILDARDTVAADGTFALALSSAPLQDGFLSVRPPEGAAVHPSLMTVRSTVPSEPLPVVLLPTRWTVRAGVHAGAEVAIHPADAADGSVLPSYWGFTFPFHQEGRTQEVLDSTRWTGALVTWPPASFPVPLALDRDGSTAPLEAADSLRIWAALNRLEVVLGRDLFEPVTRGELPPEDPDRPRRVPGAVLLRVDSTLTLRGRGSGDPVAATWLRSERVGEWSGSRVISFSAVSADIRSGWISIRSREDLEDAALVMHEAMHVLGMGHGCAWPSIQTYCESLATAEPTPEDVAYLEVLEAARELEKELNTVHGIVPAVLGQRAFGRGLSPMPDVNLVSPDEG